MLEGGGGKILYIQNSMMTPNVKFYSYVVITIKCVNFIKLEKLEWLSMDNLSSPSFALVNLYDVFEVSIK